MRQYVAVPMVLSQRSKRSDRSRIFCLKVFDHSVVLIQSGGALGGEALAGGLAKNNSAMPNRAMKESGYSHQ
jgi:hypothetical protein